MRNILILAALILGVACNAEVRKTYYESGKLKSKISCNKAGQPDGKVIHYYENGRIADESEAKDGMRHGYHRRYYDDGRIVVDYNFKNDKPDGVQTDYYKNGKVMSKATYKNGKLIKSQQYDSEGNLKSGGK